MSSNDYKPIPTSPPSDSPRSSADEPHRPLRASTQAEFDRAPPSWWKRLALVAGLVFMLWLSFRLGTTGSRTDQPSKVIYASRFVPPPTSHLSSFISRLRPFHFPLPLPPATSPRHPPSPPSPETDGCPGTRMSSSTVPRRRR